MAPFAGPGLALLLSSPPSVSENPFPSVRSWTSAHTVLFLLFFVFCLLPAISSHDLYLSQSFQLQTGLLKSSSSLVLSLILWLSLTSVSFISSLSHLSPQLGYYSHYYICQYPPTHFFFMEDKAYVAFSFQFPILKTLEQLFI